MLYYYLVEILMIDKLIIATANKHKLIEIEAIFKETKISAMPKEIPEILEDGKTFIQNSLIKAKAVYNFTKIPSLADDSGLCINSLGGNPGIYSARYGGENLSYKEKMQIILCLFAVAIINLSIIKISL